MSMSGAAFKTTFAPWLGNCSAANAQSTQVLAPRGEYPSILRVFGHFYCSPAARIALQWEGGREGGEAERLQGSGGGCTFARGGATVVFEVGAVFALVVLGAVAVVVGGQVEAGRPVLTRVGRAVIDIQLGGGGEGEEKKKMKSVKGEARLTREPTQFLLR